MKIGDFILEEQARVKAFQDAWMEANERDPDHFPLIMDPGQWDEALIMWDGTPFVIDDLETANE